MQRIVFHVSIPVIRSEGAPRPEKMAMIDELLASVPDAHYGAWTVQWPEDDS